MKQLIDEYFLELTMYYSALRVGDEYRMNLKKLQQIWAKIKIELDTFTLETLDELGKDYLEKLLRISGMEEGITLEDIQNGTNKKGAVLSAINRIRRQYEVRLINKEIWIYKTDVLE